MGSYIEAEIKARLEKVGCLGKVCFRVSDMLCERDIGTDAFKLMIHVKFQPINTPKYIPTNLEKVLIVGAQITGYVWAAIADQSAAYQMEILNHSFNELAKHATDGLLKECGTSFDEEYLKYHQKLEEAHRYDSQQFMPTKWPRKKVAPWNF